MNESRHWQSDVLDLMAQWTRLLPVSDPQIQDRLAAARLAYERSFLVIAGAEGVGKSTLINALLGVDAAPVSAYEPGTVAPIHFVHGAHGPSYRVFFAADGGAETVKTVDRNGFAQLLLQAHNANNAAGVLRGEVTLDSPLLGSGLHLVDLPGSHGLSETVSANARAYLAAGAFTVVLVNKARPMANLVATIEDLDRTRADARVVALVSNEDNLELLTPEHIQEHIHRRREAVSKLLLSQLSSRQLCLTENDVYVVHLPSFAPSGSQFVSAAAEHQSQWVAFNAAVRDHVKRSGEVTVAAACAHVLEPLDLKLAHSGEHLRGLLAGEISVETIRAPIGTILQEARTRAVASEAASRAADWAAFKVSVGTHAAAALRDLAAQREYVKTVMWLPKAEAAQFEQRIKGILQDFGNRVTGAARQSATGLAGQLLTHLEAGAQSYATTVYLGATQSSQNAPTPLANQVMDRPELLNFVRIIKELLNDKTSDRWLAYVGAVVGVVYYTIPWYLFRAFGGDRVLARSLIKEAESNVNALASAEPVEAPTSTAAGRLDVLWTKRSKDPRELPGRRLYSDWLAARSAMVEAYLRTLRAGLDAQAAAIIDREPETVAALTERLGQINQAREAITAWRAWLLTVASQ